LKYTISDKCKVDRAVLSLDTPELRYSVEEIHFIGTDPIDHSIQIYLLIVNSITANYAKILPDAYITKI